jgi:hypothetical protein
MKLFAAFLDATVQIEDPRRAEGKLYRLPHIVRFATVASATGANSYRGDHTWSRRSRPAAQAIWPEVAASSTLHDNL